MNESFANDDPQRFSGIPESDFLIYYVVVFGFLGFFCFLFLAGNCLS